MSFVQLNVTATPWLPFFPSVGGKKKTGEKYFRMPAAAGGPYLLLFCLLKTNLLLARHVANPQLLAPNQLLGAGSFAPAARGSASILDTLAKLTASEVPLVQT